MNDLHARIMRIVCRIRRTELRDMEPWQAYKEGHRDARHAAAELAAAESAGKAELLEALQNMLAAWDTVCDLKGWDKDHMPASATARAILNKAGGAS